MSTSITDTMRNIADCAKALPAAVSVELSETDILEKELEGDNHSEWLQPFVDGSLSPQESINKKAIIAKAIIKGISNGIIEEMGTSDIASLIDEGFTRITVAKQVAQGTMDTVDAMDVFVDHAAARVVTVADVAISHAESVVEEHTDVMSDVLVDTAALGLEVVAAAFPPTSLLVPFIDIAARFVKPAARVIVKKGMTMVANAARTVVKKAVPFIANKVKQAGRAIKNFFKSLF